MVKKKYRVSANVEQSNIKVNPAHSDLLILSDDILQMVSVIEGFLKLCIIEHNKITAQTLLVFLRFVRMKEKFANDKSYTIASFARDIGMPYTSVMKCLDVLGCDEKNGIGFIRKVPDMNDKSQKKLVIETGGCEILRKAGVNFLVKSNDLDIQENEDPLAGLEGIDAPRI